jgi:formate hydrogenlyase transcriptional activator
MGRQIRTISAEAVAALCQYPWPGNLRELKNFLSRGTDLHVALSELKPPAGNSNNGAKTLESVEREYILQVLRETNWVIAGRSGAAARLGMPRTALQSRMKHLGITPPK